MNKKVLIGAAAGIGVAAAVAACAKSGMCQTESADKPTMWDKMRKGIDEMPEDFPARVMYDNVEATRVATDEILSMLKEQEFAGVGTA